MSRHFHTGIVDILVISAGVIIVLNVVRVVAGKMAKSEGIVGTLGTGAGALVK